MNNNSEIFAIIADDLQVVKENILAVADKESDNFHSIEKRLRHVLSTPGKQLRPAITLACAGLFGNEDKVNSLKMATGVELLHIATLIHDDTVDQAKVRRGNATASNLWGNDIAVLLGDYIFASSAIFVCETGNIVLVKRFAETIVELSKGELIENLGSYNLKITEEEYFSKTYLKTASLFKTASFSGSLIGKANREQISKLTDFGYYFGMGYQIQDDVIDLVSTESKEGKTISNDVLEGVITLPTITYLKKISKNDEKLAEFSNQQDISKQAIEKFQLEILNSGAIDESLKVANEHFDKAINTLNEIPDNNHKALLIDIINITRQRI